MGYQSVLYILFHIRSPLSELWNTIYHISNKMEAVKIVHNHHIKGSGGCSFFFVSANMQIVMVGAAVGQSMNKPGIAIPLISPIAIPPTAASRKKHTNAEGQPSEAGFTPDGLGQLVSASLVRIADDESVDLDFEEREILRRSGAHAFRHTFGTIAAANEVPLDVLQRALGHASLNTTTIYVQAEKRRSIEELGKLHALSNSARKKN